MTARDEAFDISDHRERNERIEPAESADPMEKAEEAEPMLPIEPMDPTLPIERIDPLEPMLRMESDDQSDSSELFVRLTMSHSPAAASGVQPGGPKR